MRSRIVLFKNCLGAKEVLSSRAPPGSVREEHSSGDKERDGNGHIGSTSRRGRSGRVGDWLSLHPTGRSKRVRVPSGLLDI